MEEEPQTHGFPRIIRVGKQLTLAEAIGWQLADEIRVTASVEEAAYARALFKIAAIQLGHTFAWALDHDHVGRRDPKICRKEFDHATRANVGAKRLGVFPSCCGAGEILHPPANRLC